MPDEMWIYELSSHWTKNLILTIFHHCQFTSIVDEAYLTHNNKLIVEYVSLSSVGTANTTRLPITAGS